MHARKRKVSEQKETDKMGIYKFRLLWKETANTITSYIWGDRRQASAGPEERAKLKETIYSLVGEGKLVADIRVLEVWININTLVGILYACEIY
jgi:hypothetical protein